MNQKLLAILSATVLLLLGIVPALGATRAAPMAESVNLPGGVAWFLVILSVVLVVVANNFLRKRN